MNDSFPVEIVDPRTLVPHEKNWAIHPERQKEAVRESLERFGWLSPVLVNRRTGNKIVDGHERVEEAISLEYAGIPVRFVDVDEATELQMLATINRTASLREENTGALAALLSELAESAEGFEALPGWAEEDLEQRLKALAYAEDQGRLADGEAETDEEGDSLEEVPSRCAPGDLFACGPHRVCCASALCAEDLLRVMEGCEADLLLTDPPYGVSAPGARSQVIRRKNIRPIEGDALRGEGLILFLQDAFLLAPLKENALFYIFYDKDRQLELCCALHHLNWTKLDTLAWRKESFGLNGFKGYRPQFEMIAFGHVGSAPCDWPWYGDLGESDILDCPRDRERPGNHPTPKPVPLVKRLLANSTRAGEAVLDPFAGVGSTLIACEEMGRVAHCVEIEPGYVDVLLQRWEALTGGKAEKL